MAKNWVYESEKEVLVRNYTEKAIGLDRKEYQRKVAEPLEMNMNALFISVKFSEMDSVEKNVILNGVRQKLDDAIAKSKDMKLTGKEQREVQETLWRRMAEEREWNLVGKERGKRGESVSLKTLVPALLLAGLSTKAIADVVKKPLEVVQKFIETGVEEREAEETGDTEE